MPWIPLESLNSSQAKNWNSKVPSKIMEANIRYQLAISKEKNYSGLKSFPDMTDNLCLKHSIALI